MVASQATREGGPVGSTTREKLITLKPMFVKSRDLSSNMDSDDTYNVCEICRVGGPNLCSSENRAQGIRRLWGLYSPNHLTWALLLTQGITLNVCHVNFMDTNPFPIRDTGMEKESDRGVILLSYSNNQIEDYLLPWSALKC